MAVIGTEQITESRTLVEEDSDDSSDFFSDITCYNNKLANRVDSSEISSSFSTSSSHSLGSHWRKVAGNEKKSFANSDSDVPSFIWDSSNLAGSHLKTNDMRDLEEENLDDIWKVLKAKRIDFMMMLDYFDALFETIQDDGKKAWKNINQKQNELEDNYEIYDSETFQNMENFMDLARDLVEVIAEKDRVVKFLYRAESYMRQASNAAIAVSASIRKAENIRKMVDFINVDNAPLTVFEHEDQRYQNVLSTLPNWIELLPLNQLEKLEIENSLLKANQDSELSDQYKVGLVIKKLMEVMDKWSRKNGIATADTSYSWHSIPSNFIDSSTPSISLSDLDDHLQTSQNNFIEPRLCHILNLNSWPSASNFSNLSEDSDGLSEILSLREPMAELSLTDLVCTALSEDNVVEAGPCRTPKSLLKELETDFSGLIGSSYSFSTPVLADMIEDAMHTAVEFVESESLDLLDALRHSSTKCGAAINNFLNISSSSESESSTQLSSTAEL